VVKTLTEHLDLNDAVKLADLQPVENYLFLVLIHATVDLSCAVAAFFVDGPNLSGMVY
jgi:hypothetical protein